MKKDNILITGSHGFVGTALCEKLNSSFGEAQLFTPTSSELNLYNYSQVEDYLLQNQITCIFHLAAKLGGVHLVSNKPLEYLENNLIMNYNVVHAAIESKVKKFITLGSSCSYSEDAPLPTSEKYLWVGKPENSYGICKLVLLEHLERQSTFDWVYLIPPNIFGAGDHFGDKDAHFIPATVNKIEVAIKNSQKYIDVWGDGKQTRDFVYIDDLVHFLIASYINPQYTHGVFNVSTGIETSVKDIVTQIINELRVEKNIEIHWDVTKPTGSKQKSLDNKKILGLEPEYTFTTFQDGLKMTIQEYIHKKGKST